MEDNEKQGRDVGWAVDDGVTRPIREVIEERKRLAHRNPKARREAAYRERAGLIAQLSMCECLFPLERAPTPSGHEEWCPGELLRISAARSKAPAQVADPTLDPAMEGVEYTLAPCPGCGANVPDHDGFGVLAHIKPVHADGCGYCSHPSMDFDPKEREYRCGICSAIVTQREIVTCDSPARLLEQKQPLMVDEPEAARVIASSGDRGKIARAFLEADPRSPEHEVLLNALATKDVKQEGKP